MRSPRPFEGRYPVSLLTAIVALVPYILVTSAYVFYRRQVSADIGADKTALEVINGLATAAYAWGALVGGDLINRFRQRPMFLLAQAAFVLGCALAAAAPGIVMYGAGRVLQGASTGLLLVIALPPVIQRFPPERMPITAAAINIGFFGAITLGPLLGGVTAAGHAWRAFYAALGGLATLNLLCAALTLGEQDPPNPGMKFDAAGIALGFAATVLPFWGVGELSGHGFGSWLFIAPVGLGLAAFVALLLVEYHRREPLSPVKQMWHTFPLVGTLTAMVGGAAFMCFLMLAQQWLEQIARLGPLASGLMFWPQVIGVLITATLLGVLFRTRYLPLLILAGMLVLAAGGGALLALGRTPGQPVLLLAAGLLGLGAGATVAPGLYLAALSLPSRMVGRTFALVELVRSVADFLLAPVMLQVARTASGGATLAAAGVHEALEITLTATLVLTAAGTLLYLLGGAGLPQPDIVRWIQKNRPAIGSPLLAESVRSPS